MNNIKIHLLIIFILLAAASFAQDQFSVSKTKYIQHGDLLSITPTQTQVLEPVPEPSPNPQIESEQVVSVSWLTPATNISTVKRLVVKAKIMGSKAFSHKDIRLLLNNTPTKAGEIDLYLDKDALQNIRKTVDLKRGDNQLQIEIRNGEEWRQIASKNIFFDQKIVKSPATLSPTKANLVWIYPDPVDLTDGVWETSNAEHNIKVKIITDQAIDVSNISITGDKTILPTSARLEKGDGQYNYYATFDLKQTCQPLKVQIRLFGFHKTKSLQVMPCFEQPSIHVLSIGPNTNLQYTEKDAREFGQVFENQGGDEGNRIFKSVQTDYILGENATAAEMRGRIEEINTKYNNGIITENDVIIIYASTHGVLDEKQDFRLQGDDYDSSRPRATSISFKQDILEVLEEIPCKKLILLDACFSGGAKGPDVRSLAREWEKWNQAEGLTIITSSSASEASHENEKWENGAFTEALIKGLKKGKADADRNSKISIAELFRYLQKEVPQLVGKIANASQNPTKKGAQFDDLIIYLND